jgi:hypothetical protein
MAESLRTSDGSIRVPCSSDLELKLHSIWAEVLGHSDFGVRDDFFELGGSSLSAERMLSRIELCFGAAPALFEFIECATIERLVVLVGAVAHPCEVHPQSMQIPIARPLLIDP